MLAAGRMPRGAEWNRKMPAKLGSTAAALLLCLVFAAPAGAAEAPQLKAQIDDLLAKLEATTQGLVKWDGADRMDVRQDGDAAVADIANARLSLGPAAGKPATERARLTLDHVEIRRAPGPDGSFALSVVLPTTAALHTATGGDIRLTLQGAKGSAVVDAQSGRAREVALSLAGASLDDKASGDQVTFGPLTLSSKLVAAAAGAWTAPIDFELKDVKFAAKEVQVAGAIDRIAYTARTAGPDLAALNRLRDRIDALRQAGPGQKSAQPDAMLALLPDLVTLFSQATGELTIEGVVARPPTGEPFVALKKASVSGALTGLSGKTAALRIAIRHDGLSLAPGLLDAGKVPRRAVFDIGLEDIDTAALRSILAAAARAGIGAGPAEKAAAQQEVIAAAATLAPVLRLHQLALDTPDVGIEATGEAKGSPLVATGYTAAADVTVRGFDALPALVGDAPFAPYLPVLKEIGTPGAAASGGAPQVAFHLTSAPPKWITVNGSDVSAWLVGGSAAPGAARTLRPAEPAMTGADVRAVQQALAARKIDAPQNGAYDAGTAAAVARFQKANALNVDGVVDGATRQKLGLKAAPPPAKKKPAN